MKKNLKNKHYPKNKLTLITVFASIIILYFNSSLQDPFNAPKQWILFLTSSWLLGHIVYEIKSVIKNRNVFLLINLLSFFLLSLLISALLTDIKYLAFLGDTQRKLGFLTYLAFGIFMCSTAIYTRLNLISKFYIINFLMGSFFGIYATMQNFGYDFVEWNNPYNRIIGTLGNPNFASSMMAIIACTSFASLFIKSFKVIFKLANFVLLLILLLNIITSDSIQGLVAFTVGAGTLFIILLLMRNKGLALIALFSFLILGVFSILGMLQVGPLTGLLYKGSVSVRGFYWRAGFEMFKDKPWFGVGVDSYGSYFKQYRELGYVQNYGFDITSSNAHNTFIQFFSTSGIFTGLLYLAIISFIFKCGVQMIVKSSTDQKMITTGIFAAWLVFQAQTIISIDNVGLTVWGWLLGGMVVALSTQVKVVVDDSTVELNPAKMRRGSHDSLQQLLTAGILTLGIIFFVSVLYQGETMSIKARGFYNSASPAMSPGLREITQKTFATPLIDPYYKLKIAEALAMSGSKNEALLLIKSLNLHDKRNQDYLMTLSALAENMGDYPFAISKRLELAKFDPWNAKNYLELGLDYKLTGDFENMEKYRQVVIDIAKNTREAELAATELVR